jgi:hypothetical protein
VIGDRKSLLIGHAFFQTSRRIIPVSLIAAVRLVVGSEAAPRAGPPGATGRVLMLPILAPCSIEGVYDTIGRELGTDGAVRELMLLDGTERLNSARVAVYLAARVGGGLQQSHDAAMENEIFGP